MVSGKAISPSAGTAAASGQPPWPCMARKNQGAHDACLENRERRRATSVYVSCIDAWSCCAAHFCIFSRRDLDTIRIAVRALMSRGAVIHVHPLKQTATRRHAAAGFCISLNPAHVRKGTSDSLGTPNAPQPRVATCRCAICCNMRPCRSHLWWALTARPAALEVSKIPREKPS